MGKSILRFVVYSNFFIGLCALALAFETFVLLDIPVSNSWFLLLVFLCTVFIYSLHYFVKSKSTKTDSRLSWCRRNRILLLIILLASLLLSIGGVIYHYQVIFLKDGKFNYRNLTWFCLIPLIALAYSYPIIPWKSKSIRQIGWLKMASLAFIWSFTTVILPVLMLHDSANTHYSTVQTIALFINRFFFIAALGFLFNINDYEEDKDDKIKTMAVLLGPSKSLYWGKWLSAGINILTGLSLIYFFGLHQPPLYAAILLPPLLVFFSFHNFKFSTEEAPFVLRYDGLMIIKVLLLIFAVAISSN